MYIYWLSVLLMEPGLENVSYYDPPNLTWPRQPNYLATVRVDPQTGVLDNAEHGRGRRLRRADQPDDRRRPDHGRPDRGVRDGQHATSFMVSGLPDPAAVRITRDGEDYPAWRANGPESIVIDTTVNMAADFRIHTGYLTDDAGQHAQHDHRETMSVLCSLLGSFVLSRTIKQFGKARSFDQGAMVVMEPDGAVRAIVGGKDYGESQFNRATHAYRQPGSSFKPYVYLTALENGYTPNTVVSGFGAVCGRWSPKNYSGGGGGRMMLKDALAKSINTIAVKVSLDVGREKVMANMVKLGVTHLKKTCSVALGDQGMTPLEHTANSRSSPATGSRTADAYGIEEIDTLQGELLYSHERDEPRASGSSRRQADRSPEHHAAGRGTGGNRQGGPARLHLLRRQDRDEHRLWDAWFVGFTGQYVAGVWLGNDD